MTILEMLHAIEKKKTIYNIHYCNAGIGFQFYYGDGTKMWNCHKDLRVDGYHPSFEEAVKAEYKMIQHEEPVINKAAQ